ncbi:unnamed protein product [Ambrosiozyma monospora]|uniref:Unnamed protein product n=1 Tax=Ambrosiozyma monospora TaxID=43982 RepID=A0ACB5U3N1_AMBMO|nr:unnamed protein product [Ambrosiozyma monospora]
MDGTGTEDLKDVFLTPTLEGTKQILTSIQKVAPQVTDVVMTSSMQAIVPDHTALKEPKEFTAKDWTTGDWDKDVGNDRTKAYTLSKAYSERAAWQFVKENKVNFKLSTVLPSLIIGPQLFESQVANQVNLSNHIVISVPNMVKFDSTEYANAPFFPTVDVKDIVNFHILAFENEKLRGERIMVSQKHLMTAQHVLDFLNKTYPQLKSKIPKGDPAGKPSGLALSTCNLDDHLEAANYKLVSIEDALKRLFDQYLKFHSLDPSEN